MKFVLRSVLLEALCEDADTRGAPNSQIALAWILSKPIITAYHLFDSLEQHGHPKRARILPVW